MSTRKTPREFQEVEGGHYDKYGFYHTPNGSFWDVDGVYFDRTGKDVHGGNYDNEFNYHPGEGWIESLMCYEDEVDNLNKITNYGDEEEGNYINDYEDGDYDVYEDINEDLKNPNIKAPSYYDVVQKQGVNHNNKKSGNNSNNNNNLSQMNKKQSNEGKSIESKMQVFSKIKLKDDLNSNQIQTHSSSKKEKEVVEVDSITSNSVQDALSNKKNVAYQGFQVSADIDVSDDEEDNKKKGKKFK